METDAGGAPIWRGHDAILNPKKAVARPIMIGAGVPLLIGALCIIAGLSILNDRTGSAAPLTYNDTAPLIWGLALGVPAALVILALFKVPEFLGGAWTLEAREGRLIYDGGTRFDIALATIASVESGRTTDWHLTRKNGVIEGEISPHETQTFLMLADQSRRVIYSANADREGVQTLAASIRAHVEAARAATARPSLSSHEAAPVGEGFDL